MRELFRLDSMRLGNGSVTFKWSSENKYLAAYGENKLLSLFNKHGELVDQVEIGEQGSPCSCNNYIFQDQMIYIGWCVVMEWSCDSATLALIFEANNSEICLFTPRTRQVEGLRPNAGRITFLQVGYSFYHFYCLCDSFIAFSGQSVD